jgi:DNA-binding FrmR family transcriptional regulator
MPHSPEDKKRILTRVRRIRGQVDALERALESGDPCLAILQQIAAVRGAANGLMGEMVEIHLKDELVTGRQPRISGQFGWQKSAIYCALI